MQQNSSSPHTYYTYTPSSSPSPIIGNNCNRRYSDNYAIKPIIGYQPQNISQGHIINAPHPHTTQPPQQQMNNNNQPLRLQRSQSHRAQQNTHHHHQIHGRRSIQLTHNHSLSRHNSHDNSYKNHQCSPPPHKKSGAQLYDDWVKSQQNKTNNNVTNIVYTPFSTTPTPSPYPYGPPRAQTPTLSQQHQQCIPPSMDVNTLHYRQQTQQQYQMNQHHATNPTIIHPPSNHMQITSAQTQQHYQMNNRQLATNPISTTLSNTYISDGNQRSYSIQRKNNDLSHSRINLNDDDDRIDIDEDNISSFSPIPVAKERKNSNNKLQKTIPLKIGITNINKIKISSPRSKTPLSSKSKSPRSNKSHRSSRKNSLNNSHHSSKKSSKSIKQAKSNSNSPILVETKPNLKPSRSNHSKIMMVNTSSNPSLSSSHHHHTPFPRSNSRQHSSSSSMLVNASMCPSMINYGISNNHNNQSSWNESTTHTHSPSDRDKFKQQQVDVISHGLSRMSVKAQINKNKNKKNKQYGMPMEDVEDDGFGVLDKQFTGRSNTQNTLNTLNTLNTMTITKDDDGKERKNSASTCKGLLTDHDGRDFSSHTETIQHRVQHTPISYTVDRYNSHLTQHPFIKNSSASKSSNSNTQQTVSTDVLYHNHSNSHKSFKGNKDINNITLYSSLPINEEEDK